jgi:hypothetical protein
MRYKLRGNVTNRMLERVGFKINEPFEYALISNGNEEDDVYIELSENWQNYRQVGFSSFKRIERGDDVTPYIKNLIDLGYVFDMDNPEASQRVLPADSEIEHFFLYKDKVFSLLHIPDGRVLLQRVHVWHDDGEIMNSGFSYSDNVTRRGLNPLSIIKLYDIMPVQEIINKDIDEYLDKIEASKELECPGIPIFESYDI